MQSTNATRRKAKMTRADRLRRDRAAAALVGTGILTLGQVAALAHVHRTTLWRRLKAMAGEEGRTMAG